MANYGFDEDDDFVPPILPKKKKAISKVAANSAAEVGRELGFVARDGSNVEGPKSRRQVNKEPQGKILVTGPERVIERLRAESIDRNQPYWRIIEDLLNNSSL